MPKKHTPAYTTTKPSYVHPSLQSSRSSASSSTPSEPQSVNQRIHQLRREQAPRATLERRDELTSAVSSRTVPPELRRILHIPEVNGPKPKANSRTRRVLGVARPPPGPAAPTSWLQTSRHAPAYMKKKAAAEQGAARFGTLARVTNEELKRLPPPRSLVHQCLRTFALHWEELSEYEQHYLLALPISLKEALLSYLTLYGEKGSLSFESFKILFQNEAGAGNTGWEEVQFLDLTSLLDERFTISDLGRCLKRSTVPSTITDLGTLRIDSVADSWEEEAEENVPSVPLAKLQIPHFTHLSRLSLAHPGRASWPELLRVSPNLNKITHLSLAYWPRPSMTPNANTTSMISKHTSVSLGGSHLYSDLDDDWHEASNILRRFSRDTYSLQWLDLEGCQWLKALTPQTSQTSHAAISDRTTRDWNIQHALPGPDWNDAWRRVTYLNFFQGWIPNDSQSLQSMPAGVVPIQLLRWLRENREREEVRWRLNGRETGHVVAEWVNREKVARVVGMDIQGMRKRGEGVWCQVDFGWGSSGDKIA